eukprot:1144044-Pelagomonas_calceolata.AAC.9
MGRGGWAALPCTLHVHSPHMRCEIGAKSQPQKLLKNGARGVGCTPLHPAHASNVATIREMLEWGKTCACSCTGLGKEDCAGSKEPWGILEPCGETLHSSRDRCSALFAQPCSCVLQTTTIGRRSE